MTVPYRRFQQAARLHARRIAVRADGTDTDYATLEQMSRDAASGLLSLGLARGDRVAVWAINSRSWIIAGLGIAASGGVTMPIGTRLRGREATAILRAAGVRYLFCDARFGDFDYVQAVIEQDLPELEKIIVLQDDAPSGSRIMGLSALLALGRAASGAALDERIQSLDPDDLSDIIFTSGSTGHPKGVPMTNRQCLIACDAQQDDTAQFTPDDVFAVTFPFAHNAGFRAGWMVSVLNGVRVLPVPTFDAGALLELVTRERVTFLPAVPTILQSMYDHHGRADADLTSLRRLNTGGAPVPVELIRNWRARLPMTTIQNGYGMTETAGAISMTRFGDDDETIALTTGRPLSILDVRILDAQHNPVAPGEIGEIAVRGPAVLQQYYNNREATAAAFNKDGFLLTGDAGAIDASGNLRIADRIKDMFIVGGFNCYPTEVEDMMAYMPGIRQVAVVGVEDARLGQVGRAFIIREPGAMIDEAATIAWCKREIANYKVPRSVTFLDVLPLNAIGKIDKALLRRLPR